MAQQILSGLSIVIPVYNSEKTLALVVENIIQVVRTIGVDYEILLVNDGSEDRSWEVVQSIASENSNVCGVNLLRNYGQHNALLCGIRMARFNILITLDDDMQHPPREILKLLSRIDEGNCDVVYGTPEKLPHSRLRNFLSHFTKRLLVYATGYKQLSDQSPFRAFRTQLRDSFADFRSPEILLDVLLAWGTSRFTAVPVIYETRKEGQSNYTARKLLDMAILLLTSYSTAPLRFASWIGFAMTLFGLLILTYVLFIYFSIGSIPGWPFLVCVIAIFNGTQMFALGVFGEYIARIYNRILDQPPYIIRGTTAQQGI